MPRPGRMRVGSVVGVGSHTDPAGGVGAGGQRFADIIHQTVRTIARWCPRNRVMGWNAGLPRSGRAPKCGDTMGKTVPDMARLSWAALLEQNHVQMVSPYFTAFCWRTQTPRRLAGRCPRNS